MKLAIVIPVYNEESNLPELRRRLAAALAGADDLQWQVIYVNDGSIDASARLIERQHAEDARFTLVDLSRNFGHQAAITAGLAHAADADAVVVMDGDLQDPPEVIPQLVQAWREGGQVVRAERRSRAERGWRRVAFRAFHALFGLLTDYPIPPRAGVFGLMDRLAVAEFNRLPEKNRFVPGLRAWLGFDQRVVRYDRQDRAAGEPKQTFRRLVRYALDGLFSFSYKPLRMMTYFGMIISAVSFLLGAFYLVRRLTGFEPLADKGFTTLVTLVLFLGGVQLMAIGTVGEYLGRIYDEVKQRPLYIVKRRDGIGPPDRT